MSVERFEIGTEAFIRDGQVFVGGRGHHSGKASRVLVPEPFGFASGPIAGGQGIVAYLNGDPESPVLIGHAAPGGRPAGISAKATAIYNAEGVVISMVEQECRYVAATHVITGNVTITGNITLNGSLVASGSVTDGDGDGGA
jgi:phage gp45-like